jgi:amidophosphoribosyltransferase
MPTTSELIATGRNEQEIAQAICADAVFYQDLEAMVAEIGGLNPAIKRFDTSCFDGVYITGGVSAEYLSAIEMSRNSEGTRRPPTQDDSDMRGMQLDLGLTTDG